MALVFAGDWRAGWSVLPIAYFAGRKYLATPRKGCAKCRLPPDSKLPSLYGCCTWSPHAQFGANCSFDGNQRPVDLPRTVDIGAIAPNYHKSAFSK